MSGQQPEKQASDFSLQADSSLVSGADTLPEIENVELIQELGAGALSRVYKARQRSLDRIVAVKLFTGLSNNQELIQRFQQEAKRSSSLNHPNIVKTISFGLTAKGLPYLVLEYLDGLSLAAELKQHGRLSLQKFQEIFPALLSALAAAHRAGIVHRDIKPGNIMICKSDAGNWQSKLIDFGIAKTIIDDDTNNAEQQASSSGKIVGTPAYMSPEQCAGKKVDERADLYSLACVMYESLTGELPYDGLSPFEIMRKHISAPVPTVSDLSRKIDIRKELASVLLLGLNKKPQDRPASAEDFAKKLNDVLERITLDKVPQLINEEKKAGGRGLAILAAVGLMAAMGCLILSLAINGHDRSHLDLKPQKTAASKKKFLRTLNADPVSSGPVTAETSLVLLLTRAKQNAQSAVRQSVADSRLQLANAAINEYLKAAEYTKVNGKGSLATGRIYALVALAAEPLVCDKKSYEFARYYAVNGLKLLNKCDSIPALPDNMVIPEELLSNETASKAWCYNVLSRLYLFDPDGPVSRDEAKESAEKSIALCELDNSSCAAAADPAAKLAYLYLSEGKEKKAMSVINDVVRAIEESEAQTNITELNIHAWNTIAELYAKLKDPKKSATALKRMMKLKARQAD